MITVFDDNRKKLGAFETFEGMVSNYSKEYTVRIIGDGIVGLYKIKRDYSDPINLVDLDAADIVLYIEKK